MGIQLEKSSMHPAYTVVIYYAIILYIAKLYNIKPVLEIGLSAILVITVGIMIRDTIYLCKLIRSLRSNRDELKFAEKSIRYYSRNLESAKSEYSKLMADKKYGRISKRKIESVKSRISFNKDCLDSINSDVLRLTSQINDSIIEIKQMRNFVMWESIANIIISIHLIIISLD